MRARVWVEEWRIGDWGPPLRLGDRVSWGLVRFDAESLDRLSEIIRPAACGSITHEIVDLSEVAAASVDGPILAIDELRVAYPSPRGGSPIAGSGVLKSVSAATLMGDGPGPGGLVIMGFLIDVADD
jgi:hypothetical protein